MPSLVLDNVSLNYPIYDADALSLKSAIATRIPVGGQFKVHKNKRASLLALSDISVNIADGDRIAILGHNGAGKTTLLKVIAGFYEPTNGHVKRIGTATALINLTAGMEPDLNGYENIYLIGLLHGLTKKEIEEKMTSIAEFSELGSFLEIPIKRYSSGMLLRLAFSVTTSIESDILILDEVISTGDQFFIEKAHDRLASMISGASILILSSHNPETVKRLCNKALFLEHGQLKMFGDIDEVFSTYYNSMHDNAHSSSTTAT